MSEKKAKSDKKAKRSDLPVPSGRKAPSGQQNTGKKKEKKLDQSTVQKVISTEEAVQSNESDMTSGSNPKKMDNKHTWLPVVFPLTDNYHAYKIGVVALSSPRYRGSTTKS